MTRATLELVARPPLDARMPLVLLLRMDPGTLVGLLAVVWAAPELASCAPGRAAFGLSSRPWASSFRFCSRARSRASSCRGGRSGPQGRAQPPSSQASILTDFVTWPSSSSLLRGYSSLASKPGGSSLKWGEDRKGPRKAVGSSVYPETLSHALATPDGPFPSGRPRAIVPYHPRSPASSGSPKAPAPSSTTATPTHRFPGAPQAPHHSCPPSPLLPRASQVVRELWRGHLLRQIVHALAQHQERRVGQAGGIVLEGNQPAAHGP